MKSALAHFYFVTIHPFDDGNGRVARAIADLQFARADRTDLRFYSMSSQIQCGGGQGTEKFSQSFAVQCLENEPRIFSKRETSEFADYAEGRRKGKAAPFRSLFSLNIQSGFIEYLTFV